MVEAACVAMIFIAGVFTAHAEATGDRLQGGNIVICKEATS